MSKWGIEEKETLNAINQMSIHGKILNIAAGDGRFNTVLLEKSDKVIAIDKDDLELQTLKKECPNELKNKLETMNVDITKEFPFNDETFDGVFCTGTLHLFKEDIVSKILNEIKRILKKKGILILDFATEISRFDRNGNQVVIEEEGSYSSERAIQLFKENLKEFEINIEEAFFKEENLEDDAGYQSIEGHFLVVCGKKSIIKERTINTL